MSQERLLVAKFKSTAPRAEIANLVAQNQLTEITDASSVQLAKIGLRVFRAPGSTELERGRKAHGLSKAMQGHQLLDTVEDVGGGYGFAAPNDPLYSSQWHLPKINAAAGWDVTTGDPAFQIGCIDSGADYSHPDLKNNLVRGPSYVTGVAASDDDLGHGTWVAGVMVAETNNSLMVAGVAGRCKVHVVKALDSTNWGSYSWWASGIIYLADAGVKVINISMGGTNASSTLQSAVNYAVNKGCLIFVSRGNNSNTAACYPAGCTGVVAVGATDQSDNKAGFSSYSAGTVATRVDIAAPGVGIVTTSRGGGTQAPSGTSFSAPQVAASAALVWVVNPALTRTEVAQVLYDTATNTGGQLNNTLYVGAGMVDLEAALDAAGIAVPDEPPVVIAPSVSFSEPEAGASVSGIVEVVANVAGDNLTQVVLKVDGVTKATIPVYAPGQVLVAWDSAGVADGSRTLQLILSQVGGATATASRSVVVQNSTGADVTIPTIAIIEPLSGALIRAKGTQKISVKGDDDRAGSLAYRISVDGKIVGTGSGLAGGVFTVGWSLKGVAKGDHTITAQCWDAAGNASAIASRTVRKV